MIPSTMHLRIHSIEYYTLWPNRCDRVHNLRPYFSSSSFSWTEFLDEIQTKVLRVFLFVIHSHLYSFALRFLFLQTHTTSYSYCKGERRKTIHPSLWFKKSIQKPHIWTENSQDFDRNLNEIVRSWIRLPDKSAIWFPQPPGNAFRWELCR